MKKLFSVLVASALLLGAQAMAKPSVGFVYVGPIGDGGWTQAHNKGRLHLESLGYKTQYVESVPESDSEKVIRRLAQRNDMVITTSFGFMDPTERVAKAMKNKTFVHISGFKMNDTNFGNATCRQYQPRYLAGMAAGMLTKNNKIGFVGSYPIPEVLAGINSMVMGARSVNPKVQAEIVWINSWFDPPKDLEAAKALASSGNDVLFTTTDSPSVVQVAEERGLWAIGNDQDMSEYGKDSHATAPIFNWAPLYEYLTKNLEAGTWKPESLYWGIDTGCVELSPWGPKVPQSVRSQVDAVRARMIAKEFDVFDGGVTKQDGTKVPGPLSVGQILSMNYFVEGIVSPFPNN
jgi:basic membrane protein A